MKRHFTATGFLVAGHRTLLHWHQRLQQWMPPGGHVERNEDPVAAVLREIREEAGLAAEVIPSAQPLPFPYPGQLAAPYTILLEDSPEPGPPHQHIDLIYFCRPVLSPQATRQGESLSKGPIDNPRVQSPANSTFRWVDEAALRSNQPLELADCDRQGARLGGLSIALAEDVRLLALIAIQVARQHVSRPRRTRQRNSKLETRPDRVSTSEFPVSKGEEA